MTWTALRVGRNGTGKLYVDGEVQRQFTTSRRPYDCTGDLPAAAGKRRMLLGLGGAGAGAGGGGFNANGDYDDVTAVAVSAAVARAHAEDGGVDGVGSTSAGAMRRLTATATAPAASGANCSCSLRVGGECSVGFRGFRGLSDEVTVHRREITVGWHIQQVDPIG